MPALRRLYLPVILVALAMLLYGCGKGRAVSTPSQALLGYWKAADSRGASMSIFFSPDTATYLSAVNGESIALRYEIVEENSDEFWIRIRYLARGDKGADGEPFIIKFTDDRKGFSPHPSSAPEVLQYVYVNDRQFPEELP